MSNRARVLVVVMAGALVVGCAQPRPTPAPTTTPTEPPAAASPSPQVEPTAVPSAVASAAVILSPSPEASPVPSVATSPAVASAAPSPVASAAASPALASAAPSPVASAPASPAGSPLASPAGSPAASPVGSPAASSVALLIEARDLAFEPRELEASSGAVLPITLHNAGSIAHNVTIDELDFQLGAAPGQTTTAALADVAAGTYTFYCSIPGHRQAGMEGTLTVH